MIHPIVRLIATEPQLVAEHVGAYAELIGDEAQQVQQRWKFKILFSVLALFLVFVAVVLAGVAVMLWAITPGLSAASQWALGLAPAIPAVAALAMGLAARRPSAERAFASIKAQVASDLRMLSEARSA